MTHNSAAASRSIRQIGLVLMSIASFFLYALGVLTLHQSSSPGWNIEAAGPIPAAASFLVYGASLGAVDDNVMKAFFRPDGTIVQDVQGVLATAAAGSIPHGQVNPYPFDGSGVGLNTLATVAMWMFGIRISSLVLFYLLMIGISVFAFVCRYQDKRLMVLPLYFLPASVMLLTPICTSHLGIDQNPIGGNRFFVLATFIPAFHVFFEFIDRSDEPRWVSIFNSLLLVIQGLLLVAALLVRSSTGYVLGILLVVLIWRLYRDRRDRGQFISLCRKGIFVGTAFAFWAALIILTLPAYVHTGRVFGVFWHRAFISFYLHPDWPFGDLRNVYNCTQYIPEGLSRKAPDRNGHCVWWAYPPNARRPPQEVINGVFSSEYEKALRNAYFYVLVHYPKQAFETYFDVKSRLIKDTLIAAWNFLFELDHAPVEKGLFVIVAAQVVLFFTFILSIVMVDPIIIELPLVILPIFFLSSLAPLYVAWANQVTACDMILLMYSCLVLVVVLILQSISQLVLSTR